MQQMTKDLINWVKTYFEDNGNGYAVIGISGGKDSTIAAGVLVQALGADRVLGVLMPNGIQKDIQDSLDVCEFLKIKHYKVDISGAYDELCGAIDQNLFHTHLVTEYAEVNPIVRTNLPSRLRMATLYAVAAIHPNSRVVNTSNYSERFIGYSTKWGDGVGDFSLFGLLTVKQVLEIGDDLGLPRHLVHKAPSDGMSGKSDEEKIGFSYADLDAYILGDTPNYPSADTIKKINKMHYANKHKTQPIPTFVPKDIPLSELEGV